MRFKPIHIALVGVFVAIAVVSVYVSMIMPGIVILGASVPISLLPFVSVLTGALLGKRLGAIAMFVYMLLGLIGLPVFSDGSGGAGYIFKATFGFVPGFILGAYVSGWIVEKKQTRIRFLLATSVALIPLYAVGIVYMWGILKFYTGVDTGLWPIAVGMVPFFIKDVGVNIIGSYLAYEISRRLAKATRFRTIN